MNFAEVRFWQFLLTGLAVILTLRFVISWGRPSVPQVFDKVALFALGAFLLLCVSPLTLGIFLAVAVGSYVGLQQILARDEKRRAVYLWVLIPLQLLPLLYYKYADFVVNDVLSFQADSLRHLIIPVGISFYTFQKVAFVVDTLAFGQPLPKFLDYLNFASFFPQIVAGPIERRNDLLPQVERFRFTWRPENLNEGAGWIALGLFFKCCLADNLASYFRPESTTNPYLIWMASFLFGLRIYYDFAGYSLVALGLARCLGIRLTLNFMSPYCATSMAEFWRRWHITLSHWFRDYLYIPLGGGRVRWWALNVSLVFIVSGIWHGAGWNYAWWGALHGGFLIANRLGSKRLSLPRVLGWFMTMVATFAAWLCFYETRSGVLAAKFTTILTPTAYGWQALRAAPAQWKPTDLLVMACFIVLAVITLVLEWRSVAAGHEPYHFLRRPGALIVLVILTVLLAPGKSNAFIYFAF